MRGKQSSIAHSDSYQRITPAGAGKTFKFFAALHRAWDHPRRCGENFASRIYKDMKDGSPPQVRGKRVTISPASATVGITPAGAGKTGCSACIFRSAWDHPRRCGENWVFPSLHLIPVGSPPQVRGKHLIAGILLDRIRITPAGAGKTPVDNACACPA